MIEVLEKIKNKAFSMSDELIQIRRHIHRYPETAFNEHKTAEFICEKLEEYGIRFISGIAKTGAVGEIKGKDKGKCVLLRADIDALPIEEKNDIEYKSTHSGLMHACGHDAHIACLLGAAKVLKELEGEFSGTVKLMFQPAEEGAGGAEPMIKEGILDNPKVDAAIALHVDSLTPAGTILVTNGPVMAAPDEFDITIKGRGGHGAYPQTAVDPILTASKIIEGLQSIVSRNISPMVPAVISVCSVNSGSFYNIIPETATIKGTARTFDDELRKEMPKLIERVVSGVCASMGAEYDMHFRFMYPPLINNSEMFELIKGVGERLLGKNNVVEVKEGSMGGEDFSYVANQVASMYFKLGTANKEKGIYEPLHSPTFNIDESAISIGAAMLASSAITYLSDKD